MKVITYISTALLGFVLLTPGMASAQNQNQNEAEAANCEQLLAPFFRQGVTGFTVSISLDSDGFLNSFVDASTPLGIGQGFIIFMDSPEIAGSDVASSRCIRGNCNQIVPSSRIPAGRFILSRWGRPTFFISGSNPYSFISTRSGRVCSRSTDGIIRISTRFESGFDNGLYDSLRGRKVNIFVGVPGLTWENGGGGTCSTYDN